MVEILPTATAAAGEEKSAAAEEPIVEQPQPIRDKWQVRVGVVSLHRFSPHQWPILYNPYTDVSIVDASNFSFPMSVGIDFGLRRRLTRGDIDFRYFEAGSSKAVIGPELIPAGSYLAVRGTGPISYPIESTSSLEFSLRSAELNYRREMSPTKVFLIGFRQIGFADQLVIGFQRGVVNIFQADNNLYGLQFGSAYLWNPWERFRLGLTLKLIVFGDDASSKFFGNSPLGALGRKTTRGSAGFGEDIELTCNCLLYTSPSPRDS